MSNRLFQGVVHQMRDTIGRVIGVIDENGTLMHNRIPDPVMCKINRLTYEVKELQEKLGIETEYKPNPNCESEGHNNESNRIW